MLFSLSVLLLVVSSPDGRCGLAVFTCTTLLLLFLRTPWKLLLLRISAPVITVLAIICIKIFTSGGAPLFNIQVLGFNLIAYQEGLTAGLIILAKVSGAVSMILFLSVTTPMNHLLHSCLWMRVPKVFVEISLLSYRYVFVLMEDAVEVINAQQLRLGYSGWQRSLRSVGTLAGAIVIRAYNQSVATYDSMEARGFNGSMPLHSSSSGIKRYDIVAAVFFILILSILMIMRICG